MKTAYAMHCFILALSSNCRWHESCLPCKMGCFARRNGLYRNAKRPQWQRLVSQIVSQAGAENKKNMTKAASEQTRSKARQRRHPAARCSPKKLFLSYYSITHPMPDAPLPMACGVLSGCSFAVAPVILPAKPCGTITKKHHGNPRQTIGRNNPKSY